MNKPMLVICVSGFSGVGKDEFADHIVSKFGSVKAGITDTVRRNLMEIYGFSEAQMFGPSRERNLGDTRFPKDFWKDVKFVETENELVLFPNPDQERTFRSKGIEEGGPNYKIKKGDPRFWLSPREALQRHCALYDELHTETQIRGAMRNAVAVKSGYTYSREKGLKKNKKAPHPHVIFSDFRHIHEFKCVKSEHQSFSSSIVPVFIRIIRTGINTPPYKHKSEEEQVKVRNSAFDFLIKNDGTIEKLREKAENVIKEIEGGYTSKQWSNDYVVESHNPYEGYIDLWHSIRTSLRT